MSLLSTLLRFFRGREAVENEESHVTSVEDAPTATTEASENGEDERAYYESRAKEERAAAEKASSSAAKKSHLELAAIYEMLAASANG